MLQTISISNFILIDRLELDFKTGLTIFTGETGAGKSIIIDALMLVLGDRANASLLKNVGQSCNITATFLTQGMPELQALLSSNDIDASVELIIRRSIGADGKSKAYINDIPVGINMLASLRDYLVEFCGQHDSRGLLEAGNHLTLFDSYSLLDDKVHILKSHYHEYRHLKIKYDESIARLSFAEQERELLEHSLQELNELNPDINEELVLVERRKVLQDTQKATDIFKRVKAIFDQSAISSEVYKLQKELAKFPELFFKVIESLNRADIELNDASENINAIASEFSDTSSELEKAEERLAQMRYLARKFNWNANDLPALITKKEQELDEIKNLTTAIAQLESSFKAMRDAYCKLAKEIHSARMVQLPNLQHAINQALKELKMDKADFQIEIITTDDENNWKETGHDSLRFKVRTNPGQPFGLLDKIASGGELSRIMLALKSSMASVKSVPILIFDEIDVGISGAVSEAVGKKLSELSENFQVIAITHQPQIAGFADNHLKISKIQANDNTNLSVEILENNEQVTEIARLLSGENITAASLAAAEVLIKQEAYRKVQSS